MLLGELASVTEPRIQEAHTSSGPHERVYTGPSTPALYLRQASRCAAEAKYFTVTPSSTGHDSSYVCPCTLVDHPPSS